MSTIGWAWWFPPVRNDLVFTFLQAGLQETLTLIVRDVQCAHPPRTLVIHREGVAAVSSSEVVSCFVQSQRACAPDAVCNRMYRGLASVLALHLGSRKTRKRRRHHLLHQMHRFGRGRFRASGLVCISCTSTFTPCTSTLRVEWLHLSCRPRYSLNCDFFLCLSLCLIG